MNVAADRLAIDGGTPVRENSYPRGRGIELLGDEEIRRATGVLEARALFRYGFTSQGHVTAVEGGLSKSFGTSHALALSSGTAALYSGLLALGVGEGDEVIVPAVTFTATVGAVVMARAVPVFAEVDESLTLDPESVEANITERTRTVIPVHLDNVAADMGALSEVAVRHDLLVLEDAAQAAGVRYRGKPVGSFGNAAALSFQQGKNITCGEGGALLTSNWDVHDRALRFHDQGGQFTTFTGRREHNSGAPFIGMNLRMTELAAAVLSAQLDRLGDIVSTCRSRAQAIRAELSDLPLSWRRMPDPDGEGGSLIFFVEDAKLAVRFGAALAAEGIPAGQMYDGEPVYFNRALLEQRTVWEDGCPFSCKQHPTTQHYYRGLCPRSEDIFGRSVIIGVSPLMTDQDAEDVVTAVRKVAAHVL
ncbi:8-amino-3,8-dideoxy-alpha-D-manno-octulosonate transaminase [Kitasatospora sp. GP30]|uniref:DegT/DnrJ/EryC1/StrS family aminotransferase n=1 Tax=Kitasatospora sp. GP30 TaxID=3035084 RepID=UPI000C70BD05|nr:DegT/DnrJ/EryC1/StrS family aminotransferase [Kitasatospora sp. GP30]MDH6138469.1 8-amino-3,8-dideoxy-alpha-D-manno-octulosonate transaminase [Kitasatospora sp. GP30]